MKPLEFDLNEPPPFDNQVREAGQPCIHHVPMAPAERSLQPQVYPSRGPIEVVELDSDDEDEDNHEDEGGDDDDDDGEDDDYDEEEDDDGDDDIGDEEEDDNDDGYSYDVGYDDEDVSSGQASSSLRAHGSTSSIDSESLQIADHQRILRRRVEPQPRVNVCDFTVDLGGTRSSMTEPVAPLPLAPMSNHPTGMRLVEASSSSMLHVAPVAPPPPLQRRPTFTCPICLDCIVEETSTSCGHIFCKVCIERALLTTDQCPMCRHKITHRGIHRIHFEDPL